MQTCLVICLDHIRFYDALYFCLNLSFFSASESQIFTVTTKQSVQKILAFGFFSLSFVQSNLCGEQGCISEVEDDGFEAF